MKRKRSNREASGAVKRTKISSGAIDRDPQHTPSILRLYYPQVLSLREYLLQAKTSKNRRRLILNYGFDTAKSSQESDPELAKLLDTILVGCHDVKKEEDDNIDYQNDLSMFSTQVSESTAKSSGSQAQLPFAEIVEFVIWRLFRQHTSGHRPPYVLCHGYYYDGLGDVRTLTKGNAEDDHEDSLLDRNEHVDRLKGAGWTGLTKLVGAKGTVTLIQLLQNCGVFMPLEGGRNNFIQISGVDLSELRTIDKNNPSGGPKPDGGATLRTSNASKSNAPPCRDINTPNTIRFVRHRILYRKPDLNAKGGAYFGLPHIRRYESLMLHEVAQNIKISNITWLRPPNEPTSSKMSASDFAKRKGILAELLYYLFDSFLMPLISSNFYVTESSAFRNRLSYFRHDVWQKLSEPALANLRTSMFEEVGQSRVKKTLSSMSIGTGRVRLLPKETGLRPIINLKRRVQTKRNGRMVLGKSVNKILTPAFHVLNLEKAKALGDCNSSKDQPQIVPKASWKFKGKAQITDQKEMFSDHAQKEAEAALGTVFVDLEGKTHRSRAGILALLREHIERNIVQIGKKFYRQTTGIPQGSIVSSLLCNFFYAELEQRVLAFVQDGESLLLRLIDDFLLITTNRDTATRFVQVMHRGLPEYGLKVKEDKSKVNFDVQVDGRVVSRLPAATEFPYCGNAINTVNLNITRDETRRQQNSRRSCNIWYWSSTDKLPDMAAATTVDFSRSPGQNFYRKTFSMLKLHMHTMHLCTQHNHIGTVIANVSRMFADTAERCFNYIRCLSQTKKPSTALIIKTIDDLIHVSYGLMKRKRDKKGSDVEYACALSKTQTRW
ncbi:hypothetical protein E4T49_00185 [Aureobasidium sp. EXF-10728]|nr:hypothetical protein E4T49_00185 [Aureobasidium sp. EXF-10728]